jgi:hypothetical protein
VELSDRDRQVILIALYDLMVMRDTLELGNESNVIPLLRVNADEIANLAQRLDGDPSAAWFGATLLE